MKVLVTPWWDEEGVTRFRTQFPELEVVTARAREEILREVVDADVVFGNLNEEAFLAAKRLRWVQSMGAGVEWLRGAPSLVDSPVVVTNTRGAHAQTIAEHTFAMLLHLTRGMGPLTAAQREHRWAREATARLVGLSGMTLGVVGLGRIGSAIAQRAHGFDMRVIAVDANDVPRADYVEQFSDLSGLESLLTASDVVAVAVPITSETKGMLSAARLALLKPTAYLLVISRGGIVDEPALAKALREGKLAGAGLDVTGQEPLPAESELWDVPNLVITPHCSGASIQTTLGVWSIFVENLRRFADGQAVQNLVDKRRGY